MNAKKNALGSDLARVDAHTITSDEYDEIPELTDADMARGVWKIGDRVVSEAALAETLSVPAHRPIKPVYVRQFVALCDKIKELSP